MAPHAAPEDREKIASNRSALSRALAASMALVTALQATEAAPRIGAESPEPNRPAAASSADSSRPRPGKKVRANADEDEDDDELEDGDDAPAKRPTRR